MMSIIILFLINGHEADLVLAQICIMAVIEILLLH